MVLNIPGTICYRFDAGDDMQPLFLYAHHTSTAVQIFLTPPHSPVNLTNSTPLLSQVSGVGIAGAAPAVSGDVDVAGSTPSVEVSTPSVEVDASLPKAEGAWKESGLVDFVTFGPVPSRPRYRRPASCFLVLYDTYIAHTHLVVKNRRMFSRMTRVSADPFPLPHLPLLPDPTLTHARTLARTQLCAATNDHPTKPTAKAEKSHIPGSGFLHSVADSMRETAGIKRHDAAKPADASGELPAGEAPHEPGVVGKVTSSIAGVAGASQVLGWGASGSKIKKKRSDVEGTAVPSAELEGGDVNVIPPPSSSSLEVEGAGLSVPSGEGGVAGAEGELTLPSGSMDAGGELYVVCECVC